MATKAWQQRLVPTAVPHLVLADDGRPLKHLRFILLQPQRLQSRGDERGGKPKLIVVDAYRAGHTVRCSACVAVQGTHACSASHAAPCPNRTLGTIHSADTGPAPAELTARASSPHAATLAACAGGQTREGRVFGSRHCMQTDRCKPAVLIALQSSPPCSTHLGRGAHVHPQ